MHIRSFGGLRATQLMKAQIMRELFTNLGLSQVISEPTNFEPHKNPSCIGKSSIM